MNELEHIIDQKVKPLLETAMHKNLGITIAELETDISDRLKKSAILDFEIDITIAFKTAKRKFKHQYIARLLQLNSGNVEDAARVARIDRRSVHRIVAQQKIDVARLRETLTAKQYAKQHVLGIIENSLQAYRPALNARRYEAFQRYAPSLSEEIIHTLPEKPKTLKEAEHEFESAYFRKALAQFHGNVSRTARSAGLRFETLHRKLKSLGIDAKELR